MLSSKGIIKLISIMITFYILALDFIDSCLYNNSRDLFPSIVISGSNVILIYIREGKSSNKFIC